jgi:hypothetical protein
MQTYAQPGLGFPIAAIISAAAQVGGSVAAAKISKPSQPKVVAADTSAGIIGGGNFLSNFSTSEMAIGGVAGVALLATLLR